MEQTEARSLGNDNTQWRDDKEVSSSPEKSRRMSQREICWTEKGFSGRTKSELTGKWDADQWWRFTASANVLALGDGHARKWRAEMWRNVISLLLRKGKLKHVYRHRERLKWKRNVRHQKQRSWLMERDSLRMERTGEERGWEGGSESGIGRRGRNMFAEKYPALAEKSLNMSWVKCRPHWQAAPFLTSNTALPFFLCVLISRHPYPPKNLPCAMHCAGTGTRGEDTVQKRQRSCWLMAKEVQSPNTHCAECGGTGEAVWTERVGKWPRRSEAVRSLAAQWEGAVILEEEWTHPVWRKQPWTSPGTRPADRTEHSARKEAAGEQGQQAQALF